MRKPSFKAQELQTGWSACGLSWALRYLELNRTVHRSRVGSCTLCPSPYAQEDTTEITLRTEQGLLTTVHNEEVAGQARADNDISHNTADQLRANMSSLLSSQIVSVNSAGCECI